MAARSSVSYRGSHSTGADEPDGVAKRLAEMVEKELERFKADNAGFPVRTPFLHERAWVRVFLTRSTPQKKPRKRQSYPARKDACSWWIDR